MPSSELFLQVLLIFIHNLPTRSRMQDCKPSIPGIALTDHVFKVLQARDSFTCYYKCLAEDTCQSLNFFSDTGRCELNNRTQSGKLEFVRSHKDALYFENPQRVPLGSSKMMPAESCQEIKDVYGPAVNGRYWIMTSSGVNPASCSSRLTDGRDDPCISYTEITDATRNIHHLNADQLCDRNMATKWYRFSGNSTRMPTKCPPQLRCNTHAPGWMNGPHPSMAQGIVRRTACFHWSSKCCHWKVGIRVQNCGRYYVYKLRGVPSCSLRYCSEAST